MPASQRIIHASPRLTPPGPPAPPAEFVAYQPPLSIHSTPQVGTLSGHHTGTLHGRESDDVGVQFTELDTLIKIIQKEIINMIIKIFKVRANCLTEMAFWTAFLDDALSCA